MTKHDPNEIAERVSSVTPDKAAAAAGGYGSVSAVVSVPARKRREPTRTGPDRTETYEVEAPDGQLVTVNRNIETGETSVS